MCSCSLCWNKCMQSCTRLSSQISALSPLGMETKLKVSSPNSCQSQAAWVERRREGERGRWWAYDSLISRPSVGGHKSLGMRLGDDFLCTRSSLPPFHFLPLLPTWSQVLEICLEVVIEFQENFKGQDWPACCLFVCLFVCLLLCVYCIPCA